MAWDQVPKTWPRIAGGAILITYEFFPLNHCRNPNKDEKGPWCYTSISSRGLGKEAWDYCFHDCEGVQGNDETKAAM